jgi:hypothetical protein
MTWMIPGPSSRRSEALKSAEQAAEAEAARRALAVLQKWKPVDVELPIAEVPLARTPTPDSVHVGPDGEPTLGWRPAETWRRLAPLLGTAAVNAPADSLASSPSHSAHGQSRPVTRPGSGSSMTGGGWGGAGAEEWGRDRSSMGTRGLTSREIISIVSMLLPPPPTLGALAPPRRCLGALKFPPPDTAPHSPGRGRNWINIHDSAMYATTAATAAAGMGMRRAPPRTDRCHLGALRRSRSLSPVGVGGLVEVVRVVGVGTVTLPRPRASFVPLGRARGVNIAGTQGWGTRKPLPNVPTRGRIR